MKKSALLILAPLVSLSLFATGEVVKRGADIAADAKVVPLAEVLKSPDQYTKAAVVTEGLVEAVCQNKGCWMQLTTEAGKPGMRVTFKDYGFFVPKDSKGMDARIEGLVTVKTLNKDQADHLESEGAKLSRNKDGSAVETSFLASGVELRKR